MKLLKTSIFLLLLVPLTHGQVMQPAVSIQRTVSNSSQPTGTDTIKILAVMAEFQPDNDNTTVGNGTFPSIYSQDYGKQIVDPLPHDRNHFLAHLEFVKNYYQKASNGKQTVVFEVLPNSVTLSKTMRNYSPPINSNDFKVMGDFVQETWTLADQANPGFNFKDYNLFFIFHAGVGRDVSLPGSLGNERDLPSIYFNLPALQKFYGSGYQGVPVSGGTFNIKNTGILPQTQNREVSSFNSRFLFQITINGLLVSTVGSYLGLPDLFDTNTGLSAIGRFGLMDGQSIFAYNGAFPPEPSPWEKIRLGWITPVEFSGTLKDVTISAKNVALLSDTVVLKLRINESEYFLIENRQRDASRNGVTLTLRNGSVNTTKTYAKDTTGFYSYSIDSLTGVLVDVDEFDWALPGSGILIWHIDEKVINEKIADNKVNTDKKRRGVAVVEADGVNDIGEKFRTIFGDEVVGEGTEYDFWFAENKADLYKNIFSSTSRPDTRSNEGANSLITMKNFSQNFGRMKMTISLGDSLIKPVIFGKRSNGWVPSQIILTDNGNFYRYGNLLEEQPNDLSPGRVIDFDFSSKQVAQTVYSSKNYFAGVNGKQVRIAVVDPVTIGLDTLSTNSDITSDPVITSGPTEIPALAVGTSTGVIYRFSLAPLSLIEAVPSTNQVPVTDLFSSGGTLMFVQSAPSTIYHVGVFKGKSILVSGEFKNGVMVDQSGVIRLIVLESGNTVKIFKNDNGTPVLEKEFKLRSSKPVEQISVTDTKRDGNVYINYVAGNELYSVNLENVPADNFPVSIKAGEVFIGKPVSADFIGTGHPELLAFTATGNLYAYDGKTGNLTGGFPLTIGDSLNYTPAFSLANNKIVLQASGKSGLIAAWELNLNGGTLFYSGKSGNNAGTNSIKIGNGFPVYGSYLPQESVYNYPNPVVSGQTFIRYYVSEDSDISVKIFDLAGDYVAELKGFGQGGMDGEISWNVGNIQSGVYLARVEAKSTVSGKSDYKIIKIAIIK